MTTLFVEHPAQTFLDKLPFIQNLGLGRSHLIFFLKSRLDYKERGSSDQFIEHFGKGNFSNCLNKKSKKFAKVFFSEDINFDVSITFISGGPVLNLLLWVALRQG